jgi:integrase
MASLCKRNGVFYIQWYEGGKQRRRSLATDSPQIAKEKLRRFESAQFTGHDCPLPTKTPIGDIVGAYVEHMKLNRPENSWKKDLGYLRDLFGECCPALQVSSGRAKRCRDLRCPEDRRKKLHPVGTQIFEEISTPMLADVIAEHVRVKGLAPKTANRYREVACKLFNWAMGQDRVNIPGGSNPAAKVLRYRERAPEIRFLTLAQIEEQLEAVRFNHRLHAMVATLIYAGLRREEVLWLQVDDWDRTSPAAPNGLLRIQAKTVGGVSWQPKTKTNRAVPVSRALGAILERFVVPASDDGWLFPSPRGTRWDKDNFSQDLKAANRAAGLRWGCLDFRHTFGSQLAQRGVSLFQISAMMGNSPEICRRHYAALVPEGMVGEVEFGRSGTVDTLSVERTVLKLC